MRREEKTAKELAKEAEFLAACRKLMDKHGLQDWKVEIDEYAEPHRGLDGAAAYCLSSQKLIKLGSTELILLRSDRARRNLYLHEIAHALVFLQHGCPVKTVVRKTEMFRIQDDGTCGFLGVFLKAVIRTCRLRSSVWVMDLRGLAPARPTMNLYATPDMPLIALCVFALSAVAAAALLLVWKLSTTTASSK